MPFTFDCFDFKYKFYSYFHLFSYIRFYVCAMTPIDRSSRFIFFYHPFWVDPSFVAILYIKLGSARSSLALCSRESHRHQPLEGYAMLLSVSDSVLCVWHVSGVGYTMRDIRYHWKDGLLSVGMSNEVQLPQFRVLGHRQSATVVTLTTGK